MHTAHVFIAGFVQGVGFRQFVKHSAKQNGITGWVRNVPDGRVEALFQGQKKKIKEIILICKKGPMLSEVEDVVVEWDAKASEEFVDFSIR